MKRKWIVLWMMVFLSACEMAVEEETIPPMIEIPVVEELLPDVTEDSYDDLILEEHLPFEEPEVEEPVIESPSVMLMSNRAPAEVCKLRDGLTDHRDPAGIGVDLKNHSFPSSGKLRVAVVYVDFANYRWQREESTYELTRFLIDPIQAYYDAMSGERIEFEWVVFDEIISLPLRAEAYNITRGMDEGRVDIKNAVNTILERRLNLNEWDAILYGINPDVPEAIADVSPTSLIGGSNDSYFYHMALIGMDTRRNGYVNIAHEMGHMFGLPDLYVNVCYNNEVCNDGTVDWLLQFQHAGAWSLMSNANHPNNELLGWERFMIGWVDEEQFHCIEEIEEHIIQLNPVNSDGDVTRMVGIRLSETMNLILEMKENSPYCRACPTGLLVYTVDTSITHEEGFVKVIRPKHSSHILFEDALLLPQPGFNQLEYEGWIIEILEQNNEGLMVRITRKGL